MSVTFTATLVDAVLQPALDKRVVNQVFKRSNTLGILLRNKYGDLAKRAESGENIRSILKNAVDPTVETTASAISWPVELGNSSGDGVKGDTFASNTMVLADNAVFQRAVLPWTAYVNPVTITHSQWMAATEMPTKAQNVAGFGVIAAKYQNAAEDQIDSMSKDLFRSTAADAYDYTKGIVSVYHALVGNNASLNGSASYAGISRTISVTSNFGMYFIGIVDTIPHSNANALTTTSADHIARVLSTNIQRCVNNGAKKENLLVVLDSTAYGYFATYQTGSNTAARFDGAKGIPDLVGIPWMGVQVICDEFCAYDEDPTYTAAYFYFTAAQRIPAAHNSVYATSVYATAIVTGSTGPTATSIGHRGFILDLETVNFYINGDNFLKALPASLIPTQPGFVSHVVSNVQVAVRAPWRSCAVLDLYASA